MPRSSDKLLFSEESLRAHLEHRRQAMRSAIDKYEANKLLNSNPDELATYFAKVYEADAPSIDEGRISVAHGETKVDVSHSFEYGGWDGERTIVPGTRVTLHVPFAGEEQLLTYRASTFNYNSPRATVDGGELLFTYDAPHADLSGAKPHFDAQLSSLRLHLGWTQNDIQEFNGSLAREARTAIDSRRARLLEGQGIVASLGFPLRAKPHAPRTYAVPDVRRKVLPAPPPTSSAPYAPEPALDDGTYDQILTILANMVRVMEQSPDAFAGMGEQDIRTHFLVQLNGQFEGRAAGETFHGSGKTDILLQEKDKSIFVAECKFWDGPASLTAALDQLLDYVTWRDAKCALLLFNRNKDFSSVLAQIPGLLQSHPQRVGEVVSLGETTYRMRLRHRDDPVREILCTVLVYNVPVKRTVSKRLSKGRGAFDDND
jgi:hypothetical protein